MADHSSTSSGPDGDDKGDLDSTIDQLEALIENKREKLAGSEHIGKPRKQAGVPRLTEAILGIDPGAFKQAAQASGDRPPQSMSLSTDPEENPGAQAPAMDERRGGDESDVGDFLGEIKRIVDDGLQQAITELRAEVISDLKREISHRPPPTQKIQEERPMTGASDMRDSRPRQEPQPAVVAPADSMTKTYDPQGIERSRYEHWEGSGYFQAHGQGAPYCIMLPPPNVTGSLHMGHAFQDTLMDALIRYKRMQGMRTLWQVGTDHAGIATQMVVENQLVSQGTSARELGRDDFVSEVWKWKSRSGGTITQQLRRMGASMDWSRECFTLDPGLSVAVTEVFVRLFDEGLIYRGKRLVNWDPVLGTAISDLEVAAEEENGQLWHIRYPLEDGNGHVVVATTRPETMLGDVAVAVHPEDDRYRRIIGRSVRLPLTDRVIPVIADTYVDPEFGSGCVKITPAHDFNDYEIGARHGLPLINIFTERATINDNAPARYRGMDRYDARRLIVEDLRAQDLVARIDDHKLVVPRADRSHSVVEPFLTDQWFVRVGPLAEPAINAVEQGRVRFVPENWSKTYFEWMRNIEDWCISRQLWWGHRIPAWYDENGTIHVGRTEEEARRRGRVPAGDLLTQDPDVLDTWFSSALWPFSTLGWPEKTPELETYYPTNVLVTGFDIIFFWVARMIMMGLKFAGDVPFREVYVHGLVQDADGNKMSKSKGNVLDPIDLIDGIELEPLVTKRTGGLMQPQDAPVIEKATRRQFPDGIPAYGTDALRFTFSSMATQGRDIRFDLGRIQGYRNFCNKIWNAARFVSIVCQEHDGNTSNKRLGMPEQWILTRLQSAIESAHEGFGTYRFDLASQALYEFVWDEYCDWYIELAKINLNDQHSDVSSKHGTRRVLLEVLETFVRALHPIMPFITDEIWLRIAPLVGKRAETIMLQPYPTPDPTAVNPEACRAFDWVRSFILGVRRIRSENGVEPNKRINVLVRGGTPDERVWLAEYGNYVRALGRLEEIRPSTDDDAPDSATALAGETTILVPIAGLIDPALEIQRLDKELEKLQNDLDRNQSKLNNQSFVAKAPPEVVEKERQRSSELGGAIRRLGDQREKLRRLAGSS